MPFRPGDTLGPYEITERLGAGGMGEVWKARDTRLHRTVAIKTSNEQFTERFEYEARAVAALNHPHICTLHDVGPNYLVMEYVDIWIASFPTLTNRRLVAGGTEPKWSADGRLVLGRDSVSTRWI